MQGLDLVARDFLCAIYSRLHIGVVSCGGSLDMDMGYQAWLVLLVTGLGDVGRVALHLLARLAAILRIRVVGILDALGTDQFLVTYRNGAVLGLLVLFTEYTPEKRLASCG